MPPTPLHFWVKPIREWVETHYEGNVHNLFAGKTLLKVDETRNDLDPEMEAPFHLDALQFVRTWKGDNFRTILWTLLTLIERV